MILFSLKKKTKKENLSSWIDLRWFIIIFFNHSLFTAAFCSSDPTNTLASSLSTPEHKDPGKCNRAFDSHLANYSHLIIWH